MFHATRRARPSPNFCPRAYQVRGHFFLASECPLSTLIADTWDGNASCLNPDRRILFNFRTSKANRAPWKIGLVHRTKRWLTLGICMQYKTRAGAYSWFFVSKMIEMLAHSIAMPEKPNRLPENVHSGALPPLFLRPFSAWQGKLHFRHALSRQIHAEFPGNWRRVPHAAEKMRSSRSKRSSAVFVGKVASEQRSSDPKSPLSTLNLAIATV